jgi:hypothetical protein
MVLIKIGFVKSACRSRFCRDCARQIEVRKSARAAQLGLDSLSANWPSPPWGSTLSSDKMGVLPGPTLRMPGLSSGSPGIDHKVQYWQAARLSDNRPLASYVGSVMVGVVLGFSFIANHLLKYVS